MIMRESTSVTDFGSPEVIPGCVQDPSCEQALVAAAQAGIQGAMDELLVRHRGILLGVARRFVKTPEDAEDLVQDAMLKAIRNIGKFRKESRFGTWLIAIVRNAAVSMKRKERTACWVSIDGVHEGGSYLSAWEIPDSRLSSEQESIRKQMLRLLRTAIVNQSQKHRLVLSTCVFDERPIKAAAATAGITIGSVKSHLYRARRNLSETFARHGYTTVRRRNARNGSKKPRPMREL